MMQQWSRTSFVKVLLGVQDVLELATVRTWGLCRSFTESSLGGIETCAGFRIVEKPDPRFKTLKKYELGA